MYELWRMGQIAVLGACNGASPVNTEQSILVNGRRFYGSQEALSQCPKLAALVHQHQATVEGTTTLGFKCFITYRECVLKIEKHLGLALSNEMTSFIEKSLVVAHAMIGYVTMYLMMCFSGTLALCR
jgi:hypothetical protein